MNLLRFQDLRKRLDPAIVPGHRQVADCYRLFSLRRKFRVLLLPAAGVLLALELAGWLLASQGPAEAVAGQVLDLKHLEREVAVLEKKLAAQTPRDRYIVVDTAHNQVSLRQGGRVLVGMPASCGSGNVLEDPAGARTWVFETPRGVFSVQSKVSNPLWIKPDWAFIEAGEEIPKNSRERAVPGMLGEYAIGIGQGYFLHGTLYKRMLGRNVSHGCVRLGDEDLRLLVKTVPIGTRVFIF